MSIVECNICTLIHIKCVMLVATRMGEMSKRLN